MSSDQDKEKLDQYELRSYVEDSKRLTWCPAPNCEHAVECIKDIGADEPLDVICRCGSSFCFTCKEEAHRPVCANISRHGMHQQHFGCSPQYPTSVLATHRSSLCLCSYSLCTLFWLSNSISSSSQSFWQLHEEVRTANKQPALALMCTANSAKSPSIPTGLYCCDKWQYRKSDCAMCDAGILTCETDCGLC